MRKLLIRFENLVLNDVGSLDKCGPWCHVIRKGNKQLRKLLNTDLVTIMGERELQKRPRNRGEDLT